ncbi:O-methyltransferase [Acidiluteibacter ferrifornacis]|uniref:Methyltransferase domain-containing protein n=1 Tax=Acidiluteibacter ferrifornacis TaxID=2692424 RepID=A0A6N9NN96_9FLAO|nr:O-methyltransferase [Acidiluteibacter ferrifornacis]NBG66710.1 methyltransferase domain-containing protein [Acidiluteibacter ferrifornacis]
MDFLPENISNYSDQHTSNESDLLYRLNRETHLNVLQPRMLSGHLQGRTLSMLSKMMRPKNILEIGTYTGYSALCLAEGLAPDGTLHTIDINEELETISNKYFKDSPYSDQIQQHIGNALEIIPGLSVDFDLIFIDADKENYLNYYKLLIEKVKPGTVLIADNVLWSGKVTEKAKPKDIETIALQEFNTAIQNDERVENILFPIRDGLMIIRKI